MVGFLKPAPATARLPAERIHATYQRRRYEVFAGIFVGYAACYLVRNNLALAIPDIIKEHPEHTKAALGTALTGLSIAYGMSKFFMGSVSDRSNPRWFLPLGLVLSCVIMFVSGTAKALYGSLAVIIALQTLNGWVQGMCWPPCGKTMVHWFSTRERGLVVSLWNVAHNLGGATAKGFSFAESNRAWALYEFAAIPGTIVCGWMSDKVFHGRRAPATILFMGLTLVAVVVYWFNLKGPLWIDYASLVAIGFLIYGPIMMIGLHALDLVPKKAAGTAAGFTGFFGYVFGSAISGTGVGWIADHWGWRGVFITMVGCCVLTMACSALTLRSDDLSLRSSD